MYPKAPGELFITPRAKMIVDITASIRLAAWPFEQEREGSYLSFIPMTEFFSYILNLNKDTQYPERIDNVWYFYNQFMGNLELYVSDMYNPDSSISVYDHDWYKRPGMETFVNHLFWNLANQVVDEAWFTRLSEVSSQTKLLTRLHCKGPITVPSVDGIYQYLMEAY